MAGAGVHKWPFLNRNLYRITTPHPRSRRRDANVGRWVRPAPRDARIHHYLASNERPHLCSAILFFAPTCGRRRADSREPNYCRRGPVSNRGGVAARSRCGILSTDWPDAVDRMAVGDRGSRNILGSLHGEGMKFLNLINPELSMASYWLRLAAIHYHSLEAAAGGSLAWMPNRSTISVPG
jgi:hypothetical protein